MATVTIKEPKIITFEYSPEDKDKDRGSCLWARFNLDLVNYSMFIESDCGSYAYSWVPTPQLESFLKLCSRFDEEYLLCKISSKNVVDNDETWKNIQNLINECEDYILAENDWDIEDIKEACYSSSDEKTVHDEIEVAIKFTSLDTAIDDFELWENIEKDYPVQARTIVNIYTTYIIPAIKERLRSDNDA